MTYACRHTHRINWCMAVEGGYRRDVKLCPNCGKTWRRWPFVTRKDAILPRGQK